MRRSGLVSATAVCGLQLAASMGVVRAGTDPGVAMAPRMEFTAPAAGSYTLQRIQRIADAAFLDGTGRPVELSAVTHGKITLLTFFYTYCVDPLGCPFAHVTLVALRDRVRADPALAQRVRFVSVSLDPTHDTPAAIADYAHEFTTHDVTTDDGTTGHGTTGHGTTGDGRTDAMTTGAVANRAVTTSEVTLDAEFEWRFLTARRVRELLPVLEDFGQDVTVETDVSGRATRTLHHMLKMFLIDAGGEIREIYTLSFLQPQVMFNDIKTLALERVSHTHVAPARLRPRQRQVLSSLAE